MAHLKLVNDLYEQVAAKQSTLTTIHTGRRYQVEGEDLSLLDSSHGVIGDYKITTKLGQRLPMSAVIINDENNTCYFWDMDIDLSQAGCYVADHNESKKLPLKNCKLAANRLLLNNAELIGPELVGSEQQSTLTLSPQFDLTFSTDCYAAQLGVIHLVQSSRFITLENHSQIRMLDTGDSEAPVLYLQHPQDNQPVKLVTAQQQINTVGRYNFRCEVSQQIPAEVNGETVASVTVLEQYASYFMQRALPTEDQHAIWTPVYAPILWGWSIRVGRRTDGEWGILRRKLILPTGGNDGLQLPSWETNTIDCSPPQTTMV